MLNRLLNRLLTLVGLICLVFVVFLVMPLVAFAQEAVVEPGGGGLLSFLSEGNVAAYILVALALVEVAKRVVQIIPGKPYDAQIGVVEGLLRRFLDLVAGKNGDPADPSLIKRE